MNIIFLIVGLVAVVLLIVVLLMLLSGNRKRGNVVSLEEVEQKYILRSLYDAAKNESVSRLLYDELKAEHARVQDELSRKTGQVAGLMQKCEGLQEKITQSQAEFDVLKKQMQTEFENLANKILEEKSQKFVAVNEEKISGILKPLGENISEFKKKTEEMQQSSKEQYGRFDEKIKSLSEQTATISKGATDLANALRSQKKMQGDWGEQILENILQESGLVKDHDYYVQMNVKDGDGQNQRPDFVVKLPNGRVLVIDSKVTLNAYVDYCNDSGNDVHLDNFLRAVKANIDGLSNRNYEKNVKDSLDFVLMFFPIEQSYLLAIQSDSGLLRYAYDKKVLLVSQSSLLTTLRMVSDMWNREKQDKNIAKIIDGVEKLYDKFVSFVEDMEKIGRAIEGSQKNYITAMNKLNSGKGNIIKRASDINTLGATTKKKLPAELIEQAAEEIEFEDA